MSRILRFIGTAAVIFAATVPLGGQGTALLSAADSATIVTSHPALRDSMLRLARGSALWREALKSAGQRGRQAVILTPDQVVVAKRDRSGQTVAFDADVLAEVTPLVRGTSEVNTVLVVVNLPLVERLHARRNSLPAEIETDLDRILAHEVYGHALPYLLAGDLSGHCADPVLNQRASDACAIQRENAIRAELGLGRRLDAGLSSLALAWN